MNIILGNKLYIAKDGYNDSWYEAEAKRVGGGFTYSKPYWCMFDLVKGVVKFPRELRSIA